MSRDLKELQARQERFIQSRDWEQFHIPKSIAMAISVEANELLEVFQWHDNLPADAYEEKPAIQEAVEEELADVLIYSLSMASQFDIDLAAAVDAKLDENEARFDTATAADVREELFTWKRDSEYDRQHVE